MEQMFDDDDDVYRWDDPSPCKSVSSVSSPKLDKPAVEKHKLLSKSHVSNEDSHVEDKQSIVECLVMMTVIQVVIYIRVMV